MAENVVDIDELQMNLELAICGLSMEALKTLAVHIKVDTEGLRKIQISKRVRERIESNLEAPEDNEDKMILMETDTEMVSGLGKLFQGEKDVNVDNPEL